MIEAVLVGPLRKNRTIPQSGRGHIFTDIIRAPPKYAGRAISSRKIIVAAERAQFHAPSWCNDGCN